MSPSTFTVWAGMCRAAKCRNCRQPIVFRINQRTGKTLPFNGTLPPLRTFTDEQGRAFEVLSRDDLHFVTCALRLIPTVHRARRRPAVTS